MDEIELRLRAALGEQKAICDIFMERCINHVAHIAVLNAQISEQTAKKTQSKAKKIIS